MGLRRMCCCKVLFGASMLLLPGCFATSREAPLPIHTFTLSPDSVEQRPGTDSRRAGAPVLLLNLPLARPGFDSARMAYVNRPHEVAYYASHQWADAPARMLRSLLLLQLERRGAWQAVVALPSAVRGDYRLDLDQVQLVQEFLQQPSRVRLSLRAQLFKLPDQLIIGTREFDATEPASSEDAYGGVVAANRAVATLFTELQGWLAGCTSPGARSSC